MDDDKDDDNDDANNEAVAPLYYGNSDLVRKVTTIWSVKSQDKS